MDIDTSVLTIAEKRELATRLAYELTNHSKNEPRTGEQQAFWDALIEIRKNYWGYTPVTFNAAIKEIGIKKFNESCAWHMAFIKEGCSKAGTIRVPHRNAILVMILKLKAQWLSKHNKRVTLESLMMPMDDMMLIVDNAFPGYVRSGMLHWVARAFA